MRFSNYSTILKYFTILFQIIFHSFIINGQENILSNKYINVQDFGAIANDTIDDTVALRKAVAFVSNNPNSELYFPPGKYFISDPKAIKIQQDALFGKLGNNPQSKLFRPNTSYVIGLDFKGAKNLTIKAKNAKLICDGWMEPLSFRNCDNITLNGITIDYKRPANSEGKIIQVGKDFVDVHFSKSYPVSKGLIMLRLMMYDIEKQSLVGGAFNYEKKEFIAPQTIRFYGKQICKQAKIGRMLLIWSGFHYRPAILIYKTKDIVLNDVSIRSQAGMGIVGHLSKNITMNRLEITPRKGSYISTNTDATHFATNRGFIRFNNCKFAGQGDDATNVHTYYTKISDTLGKNTCMLRLGRGTHSQYLDEPQVGDIMAIVERNTLKEVGYVSINRFWTYPKESKVKIEYEGKLPLNYKSYFLINITASPSLEFINCHVKSHRARSVLVKTRKVLIEGCTFENTTGTAIHIGAEGDWSEGPASQDVIVRNNIFNNCGIGGESDGTLEGASAVAIHVKAKDRTISGLHKRILIENNVINKGIHAIVVKGAADVTIRNNRFNKIQQAPIKVGASKRVKAYQNKGASSLYTKDIVPVLPNLN